VRRYFAIAAVNVIVFLAIMEIVSLAAYYVDTGQLFYLHRKTYDVIAETRDQKLTGDALHPYFGPTHTPGYPFDIPSSLVEGAAGDAPRRLTINNFGFPSARDFPFRRSRDDQFIIGIFGGSVGVWFCHAGAPRLIDELKKSAAWRGRDVVPLCFSHEGYKQPQQLLVLSYFLSIGQPFDLVVNIDGFNEVALSAMNDRQALDISMPSVAHLAPLINLVDRSTLTPEKLQSLATIERYKERLNALAERLPRTRIASAHFVLERYRRMLLNAYQEELGRFSNLPANPSERTLIAATPPLPREGTAVFDEIARSWARSSQMMHGLLAPHGTAYLHVLQPNQYLATRRFGDDEARVALNAASPFKESVEKGYPALLRELESGALRRTVNVADATRIFDSEPSAVYMDDCCHYTLRGNQLLAEFIAARILAAPTSSVPQR
jgi:hypothetical protein